MLIHSEIFRFSEIFFPKKIKNLKIKKNVQKITYSILKSLSRTRSLSAKCKMITLSLLFCHIIMGVLHSHYFQEVFGITRFSFWNQI